MLTGNNIEVLINNKTVPYLQSIEFGASVDDIIIEARFLCAKEPVLFDRDGVLEEVYGIGLVEELQIGSDNKVAFSLQLQEDSPNAEYFKDKFYD